MNMKIKIIMRMNNFRYNNIFKTIIKMNEFLVMFEFELELTLKFATKIKMKC